MKIRLEAAKIKDAFQKMNLILSRQQKIYGIFVLICTLFAAVLETVGVSAILPIVNALLDIEGFKKNQYVSVFMDFLGIENNQSLIAFTCGAVIFVYVIKNLFFVFQTWISKKYCFKVKRELGIRVMNAYMNQGYIFFVNNDSSRLMQGMTGDVTSVYNIISSLFALLTKCFTILAISIFIMIQSKLIAIMLLLLAGGCVLAIQLVYRKSLTAYGEALREASWENAHATLEAIQGSKEVLVTGRQDFFVDKYSESLIKHNNTSIKVEMAVTNPAYWIEMVCVAGLLIAVVLQMGYSDNPYQLVSNLSVIAVAAFRILPCVGAVSSAINTIMSNVPCFNIAYNTLREVEELEKEDTRNADRPGRMPEKICLKDEIEFQNIFYKYPNTTENVLKDVNLKIKAKSSVGIIGTSGAGKSTLIDILLGLLVPQEGAILADGTNIQKLGKCWNCSVGYVPQSIYLLDSDVRENIAFGIRREEIDDSQIWKALEMAQLAEFIRNQPKQLDTVVGERGIKFSGGQQQRLAIARALFSNPEILVLDEATAALDNETESAVMDAIEKLQGQKTLIVVAHRLTTIRQCDEIYEVKDGKVIKRNKKDIFG